MEVLRQKIADIESRELALADDFVGKTVSKEMYDRLAMKYQNQRKEAEARVSQLSVDYKDPLDFFDKAAVTSSALCYLHQRFRFRQRRILLRAVFRTVKVQNRGIVGLELNPPFSTFIGNDPRDGGIMPLENPPTGSTQSAPPAALPSLPTDGKRRCNVFEDLPIGRTRKDTFEQLVGFTPTEDFLALMELLKLFPDLNELCTTDRMSGERSIHE